MQVQPLSARELLTAWERGARATPPERALVMLEAAGAGDASDVPIGTRDSSLLELRGLTFGSRCDAVVDCPTCAETLELELDLDDLRVEAETPGPELTVEGAKRAVRFRVPNTRDLLASVVPGDAAASSKSLLDRCLIEPASAVGLNRAEVQRVIAAIAAADPQADLQLDLACPACDHRWRETFDPVAFLWDEVEGEAARLLLEVHHLATAYGWTEPQVLALSPERRAFYIEATEA
jgi:hypothetical protein